MNHHPPIPTHEKLWINYHRHQHQHEENYRWAINHINTNTTETVDQASPTPTSRQTRRKLWMNHQLHQHQDREVNELTINYIIIFLWLLWLCAIKRPTTLKYHRGCRGCRVIRRSIWRRCTATRESDEARWLGSYIQEHECWTEESFKNLPGSDGVNNRWMIVKV